MFCKKNLWLAMLLLPILMAITSGDLYSSTCTGSDPCNACKNCNYCKHCAKEGGTCGVCKRRAKHQN